MYGYDATWQIEGRGESKQKKETEKKKDKKDRKDKKGNSNLHGSVVHLFLLIALLPSRKR